MLEIIQIVAIIFCFAIQSAACVYFARIARRETKKAVCHVEHIEMLHGVMNELRKKLAK